MKRVLVTDPITDSGKLILESAGLQVDYYPDKTEDDLNRILPEIHGWIIRSGTKITEDHFTRASKLEAVGRAGVGVDNIDIPAATKHGVVVMNTPDVNTISAAEHTVGLILAMARNIPQGHSGLQSGEWNRHLLVGTELRGKTLGVVGLGKIGREVIQRCRSFGMKILGYDPYINQEMFNPDEVCVTDIDTLTKESDIIALHVPLVDGTRDLFNTERFALMKSTSRIVNVARGGVINEEDLAIALKEGVIAGAAIDVFVDEPISSDHPLVGINNCILTPHLGASTAEAKEGVSIAVCEQIRDYLENQKLTNALNLPISNMSVLGELRPYLELAEYIGKVQGQVVIGAVKHIKVDCFGHLSETKPIALAFLKGLLSQRTPDRINYINAESVARELGISIEVSSGDSIKPFSHLIRTFVTTDSGKTRIDGTIFGQNQIRFVNVLGFEMELNPIGNLVLVKNRDVPGVVGNIGSLLGESKININAYLLGRDKSTHEAFAVIRTDSALSDSLLNDIRALNEIISVIQIDCN